jgi:hypothetical protein
MPHCYNSEKTEVRIQMDVGDQIKFKEFKEAGIIFSRIEHIAEVAFLASSGEIYAKLIDRRYMLPLCLNPCRVLKAGDRGYEEAWRALKLGYQAA